MKRKQLIKLLLSRKFTYCRLVVGDDWSDIIIKIDHGRVTFSSMLINKYVPIVCTNDSFIPLLDNPTIDEEFNWYVQQIYVLLSYLRGERDDVFCDPIIYCKYCHRHLTSYKSMLAGCGKECKNLSIKFF